MTKQKQLFRNLYVTKSSNFQSRNSRTKRKIFIKKITRFIQLYLFLDVLEEPLQLGGRTKASITCPYDETIHSSLKPSFPEFILFSPDFANNHKPYHCAKSVRYWSFSGLYFGLNTQRYGASLRIQSECGKIRTRKTPNKDTFHAVYI